MFFPGANIWIGTFGGLAFSAASFIFLRFLLEELTEHIEAKLWRKVTIPVLSAVGSLFTVLSDPIWRLVLGGESELLILAGLTLLAALFVATLRNGLFAYLAFLLAGVLAVFSPIALVLSLIFLVVRIALGRVRDLPRYGSWIAFALFMIGAGALWALLGFDYKTYILSSLGAATPLGWFFFSLFSLATALVAGGVLNRLTSDNRTLEFFPGLLSLTSGWLAYSQLSPLGSVHYWCLDAALKTVESPLLLAVGAALSGIAMTLSLALFVSHAFHLMPRDYSPWKLLAFLITLSVLGVGTGIPSSIMRKEAHQIRELLQEAAAETARECEGIKYLFSDGALDEEVKAVLDEKGQELEIRPLVVKSGLSSAKELNEWIVDDSEKLKATAIHFGFDLWQRERKELPIAGGLVARVGEWPEGELERARMAAEKLGTELKILFESGAVLEDGDIKVREKASAVLWRISKMARQRGNYDFADQLEEANLLVKHMLDRAKSERMASMQYFTDEEKLQFALKRADFKTAKDSAEAILRRKKDHAAANFALGMYHLLENRLDAARPYLETALEANPDEPAFLNNLAILCLKKGELKRAKELSDRAIEIAPEFPAINETGKRISDEELKAKYRRFDRRY